MAAIEIIWSVAGVVACVVVAMIVRTFHLRRVTARRRVRDGATWRRAYHLAAELCAGRSSERNSDALVELIATTDRPMLVGSALAIAVRQERGQVPATVALTLMSSELPTQLRDALDDADPNRVIEALEIAEVLRISSLLGDVAVLTRHDDHTIRRAACDALVAMDPRAGASVLIGMVDDGDTWVLDALGRATHGAAELDDVELPLGRAQWASAPMLARHALANADDRAGVSHAIAALIGALDDPSPSKRLASVTALAAAIEHPAAQIALVGALGSSERMIRFAAAANLVESAVGQAILHRVAASSDGSDAARMAAEVLWAHQPHQPGDQGPLHVVA